MRHSEHTHTGNLATEPRALYPHVHSDAAEYLVGAAYRSAAPSCDALLGLDGRYRDRVLLMHQVPCDTGGFALQQRALLWCV